MAKFLTTSEISSNIETIVKEAKANLFTLSPFGVMRWLLILLIGLAVSACGRADIELHTTVEQSGKLVQAVSIRADGLMASAMRSSLQSPGQLRSSGWQSDMSVQGGVLEFTAKRSFAPGEQVVLDIFTESPSSESSRFLPSNETSQYVVLSSPFKTIYSFEYTFEPSGNGDKEQSNSLGQDEEALLRSMFSSMFSLSWKLTVPGKILSSNADSLQGNTATWHFNLDDLQKGRTLTLKAEYIKTINIVFAVLGTLLLAALASMTTYILMIRRRKLSND